MIEIKGLKTSHSLGVKTAHIGPITAELEGMSNVLKVSLQTTTHSLADRGWSQRRMKTPFWLKDYFDSLFPEERRPEIPEYLKWLYEANGLK
jgi:hypothetical protein